MKTTITLILALGLTTACGNDEQQAKKAQPQGGAPEANVASGDEEEALEELALAEGEGEGEEVAAPEVEVEGEGEGDKATRLEKAKARKAAFIAKFDVDGDGKLSQDERKTARETVKANIKAKIDTNGDGTVDSDEISAASAKLVARWTKLGEKHPKIAAKVKTRACARAAKLSEKVESNGKTLSDFPLLAVLVDACQGDK